MDAFDGVKKFINSMKAELRAIEIVLLNAGAHNFVYKKSPDGWEDDLEINLLLNILLGLLLLPWVSAVKKPGQIQHEA
jgi:NAD(P)-dependent dehydrogenase (short-subunit alcohol dehydrogenase family)